MSTKRKGLLVVIGVVLIAIIVTIVAMVNYNSPEKKAQRLLEAGQKYLEEMDYEQAITCFDELLEIDPAFEAAYFGIADANVKQKKYADAEKILLQNMNYVGQNEDTYIRLSEIYAAQDEIEKEIDILTQGNETVDSKEIVKRLDAAVAAREAMIKEAEEKKKAEDEEKYGFHFSDAEIAAVTTDVRLTGDEADFNPVLWVSGEKLSDEPMEYDGRKFYVYEELPEWTVYIVDLTTGKLIYVSKVEYDEENYLGSTVYLPQSLFVAGHEYRIHGEADGYNSFDMYDRMVISEYDGEVYWEKAGMMDKFMMQFEKPKKTKLEGFAITHDWSQGNEETAYYYDMPAGEALDLMKKYPKEFKLEKGQKVKIYKGLAFDQKIAEQYLQPIAEVETDADGYFCVEDLDTGYYSLFTADDYTFESVSGKDDSRAVFVYK